jgi:glycosyltransferase involved in cell wall biosynthesis
MDNPTPSPQIAVVIPAYRVRAQILGVLDRIGPEVARVYVVDDRCPEGSGALVGEACRDPRVRVLLHEENQGVGGATVSGYRQALADGMEIIVKLDGDGQMDPALVPRLVAPVAARTADYAKGNRFFDLEGLAQMPGVRLFGNAVLSFCSKISSGYWNIFDPTNGFTAIHRGVLERLPLAKMERRYFFESDMLFRLNTLRAAIADVPMEACYGEERSSLNALKVIPEFLGKHLRNFAKRIFYNYFLRDFNLASLQLLLGSAMLLFGCIFGGIEWYGSFRRDVPVSSGTVMLAALPTLIGVQLWLAFLSFDMSSTPVRPVGDSLQGSGRPGPQERRP